MKLRSPKKREARIKARREMAEATVKNTNKPGFHSPGSQNPHKGR